MISAGSSSAFRLVFGSNPAGLYGWGGHDEDLLSAQKTSVSGQFAQQWELRRMAKEAALRGAANRKNPLLSRCRTSPNLSEFDLSAKLGSSEIHSLFTLRFFFAWWMFHPAEEDSVGVLDRRESFRIS